MVSILALKGHFSAALAEVRRAPFRESGPHYGGIFQDAVTDWSRFGSVAQGREKVVGPLIQVLSGTAPFLLLEVDEVREMAKQKEAKVEGPVTTRPIKIAAIPIGTTRND